MAYYLDTSAAVRLVVAEPETAALVRWIGDVQDDLVSSDLLRTELLRATRRGAPHAMPRARAVLDSLVLLSVPTSTFERAASLEPDLLRSLDALHLAAALELGDDLDGFIAYDERLGYAARLHGMEVIAPGA
jgi:predicted nucleic acid-binding protein